MNKKINSKKIVKYAATGLLFATLTAGCGIAVHDASIDHTNEICPTTKTFMALGNSGSALFNCGVNHQINLMTEEYEKQGYDTNVNFNQSYIETQVYRTSAILHYDKKTGKEVYVAPTGYTLIEMDGKYYAEKTVVSNCMTFESKLTREDWFEMPVVDGEELVVPVGYRLEEIDGKYYAVRNVVTHKTLKLK